MFGTPKSTATGFTYGTPTATAAAAPTVGGFQFASGDNKLATAAAQQAKPKFGIGSPLGSVAPNTTPTANVPTGLNFNLTPSTNVQAVVPQLNFGTPTTKPTSVASIFTPTATSAQGTPTAGGFTLTETPKATAVAAAASSLAFPIATPTLSATATTSASNFNLTPSTGATFSLGTSSATTAASGIGLLSATPATTTQITTAPGIESAIPTTGNLTFAQLEDAINKWTIDLEEQGKLFSNQAKQLNAWDRLLISNSEKILSLNNGVERVKQQQQQLDQELDFVLAQQKELEDLIVPLEKELSELPATDLDRNQTYQMAENLDSQLKQMSEDLKEIIEHLNESNKNQEVANPIIQIGKILNAHMNSLQWIDRNTSKISSHLDQISKMHDMNRRNHEVNLQKTYD